MVSYVNQYLILFNKAKTDLYAANLLYARFNQGNTELDLEVICFHLQQCAEKLMKAVLSKREIYYPKNHDLENLLTLLDENSIDLNPDRDILLELNDYAVEGRYSIMQDDLENIQKIFSMLSDMTTEARKIVHEE